MRTLMSALFTTTPLTGIALGTGHGNNLGSSRITSLIWTTRIDSTPDMGFTTPGPTDPNAPST
jgi:hypothetical protein